MKLVAETLQEQADRVAGSGEHARAFRSPIDAAWVLSWRERADSGDLRKAIGHACSGVAWASSAGAGMLDEEADGGDGDDTEATEGDDEAAPAPLSDDPILDAFSPWYQISPDPAREDRRAQVQARMLAAIRRPVRTLIATEILAEGVNLQECGMVAHYDLPWNPTRLIQRNGRVDRRLDARFEDPQGRRAVCDALGLPAAAVDLYQPPAQIYHLTVLPIEPAFLDTSGEPPAERVRKVLTRKLKSIRVLFGLASWPVVLRAADAQRVLTGELEFETPGFRRRERLFEQWRKLADLGATLPADAPGGTLVVEAGVPWFESLRLESAGTTAPSWEHVRAAVVQTSPRGRAIHSAVDWQVATKAAGVPSDGPVTAITGALVLEEEAVVGWDYRQRRNAGVTRWSFLPAVLSLREGQELADTPCPLAATDDDGRARVPTSPTSFAEDILSVAIEALLEGEHPSMQQRGSMPPAPELDVDATGWLRWFLARPFFSAKLDPRDGDDVLAQPPPAGRWNLWIVRR